MEFPFKNRLSRVKKELKRFGDRSFMILSSAPHVVSSRDLHHPYRQSSDFFFLTGTAARHLLLLVSPSLIRPLLITEAPNPTRLLWEGKIEDPKQVAKRIGAELRVAKNVKGEILSILKKSDCLFYQNEEATLAWHIAEHLMALPSHERGAYPRIFVHSDMILERLRLLKDRSEIDAIRRAAAVSLEALFSCTDTIQPGVTEGQIVASIEYVIRLNGCTPAFDTIVASGPSAAVLHYSSAMRRLRSGELLLIDWGAAYKLYCSDVSRTIPVTGKFTSLQRDLYQIVLSAQSKALKKVRPGVKIKSVYDAAAHEICDGLRELGVLKGKSSKLFESKAFKKYFPHGIGHSVGLDAHDIGNLRGNNEAVLEKGMVFTVEPGIYFAKKIGRIPACGIRIEDTIHVTNAGHENLTDGFPKKIDEIEQFMEDVKSLEIG